VAPDATGVVIFSVARIVLLIGGAGRVEGCGICKRWLQPGQFNFSPAKLTGDSSAFLQRGQV
jgi:hypothetical protein